MGCVPISVIAIAILIYPIKKSQSQSRIKSQVWINHETVTGYRPQKREEMTRNKVRKNCQPFGLCAWNTRQENDSHDAKQKAQISLISFVKHLFLVLAEISSRQTPCSCEQFLDVFYLRAMSHTPITIEAEAILKANSHFH